MGDNITRFVLLFEGRTGSTFIMSALDSHPNVISKGELLVQKIESEQEQIIRNLYTINQPNIKAIGFKTKLRDIANPQAFLQLMAEFGVKVIFMYRKNLIRLALSRLNAQRLFKERGRWNLNEGEAPLPPFSPTIDEFEEALQFRKTKEEELNAFMQTVTLPMIVRDYEDLLNDGDKLFADYFDYIGVEPQALQSSVVKNTAKDMRKILLNYDEIKVHYANTQYKKMFD